MRYTDRLHKQRGVPSGIGSGKHEARSSLDQLIANKGHCVHKLKAKDSTGRWAYYFVYVEQSREPFFLKALSDQETINLEDYGKVIVSNYGEEPNSEVIDELMNRFGWDVSEGQS